MEHCLLNWVSRPQECYICCLRIKV